MREVVHRRPAETGRRLTARDRLERYFEFRALGADWKTEILAGATTFITMAYIVFVNPTILRETGMPFQAWSPRPATGQPPEAVPIAA